MKKLLLLFILFSVIPSLAQFKSVWDQVPESVKKTKAYKRYEWFYRPRTDEYGNFPKEHIEQQRKIEEDKVLENKSLNKTSGTSDLWTNIGPSAIDMSSSFVPYWGKTSGRVRGMDVSPVDPNLIYVGAAAGGIWKSTDGGTTWTDKSAGLTHLTFGAIAMDPNNTNIVYAGTGESIWYYNNVTYEGDGLYKTTNGGDTWTKIINGLGTQTQFADIKVNPSNSNILLAALGSGNWNNAFPSNEGIWRSSDAGVTWTRVINVQDAFDVAFHPTNGSLAYAASGNQSSAGGFFISTNGGVTWTQSNTGLPSPTSIGRIQFELSTSSPSTFYSLVYNNTALSGGQTTAAFKSTDGGANWVQISSGKNIAGTYDGTTVSDQGSYDLCLSVHPTDPNTVLFGNVELSKTTDGSTINFVRNPSGYNGGVGAWAGYSHTDIHKIVFAPSNGNIVYLGCDGGVYKSTNAGSTWTNVNNGINTIQFYRVASHPTNASILFGGAQDNGDFSTSNKGASNWSFNLSGDGMECFIDYSNPSYVYMSTQYGSLYRSTNGGSSFSTIRSNIANCAWLVPFWQHPSTSSTIYTAENQRLARSINRGSSWTDISAQITTSNITSAVQSSVITNNMMLVASDYTTSPGIFKSTDEGFTWSNITSNFTSSGFTGVCISRVIADPLDGNTFYIARYSYSTGMLTKTTNFGTTWTDISGNLPSVPVNDLFIDPSNGNHLYAGNDFGVYFSSDGGTNWTKLSNGMPFVPVQDFSFYNYSGTRYLRAATHGRGVYELNIDNPLPVELTSFTAAIRTDAILLNWSTATEVNNYGFDIERSIDGKDFQKIAFVDGSGNSNSYKHYSFLDRNVSGFLSYRLKQMDKNGQFTYSDMVKIDAPIGKDFAVYQNYPNPFNPVTSIKYKLPFQSNVRLIITNALGQEVQTIFNGEQEPGIYEFPWDGQNHASGVYFASIYMNPKTGSHAFNKTIKMILNK